MNQAEAQKAVREILAAKKANKGKLTVAEADRLIEAYTVLLSHAAYEKNKRMKSHYQKELADAERLRINAQNRDSFERRRKDGSSTKSSPSPRTPLSISRKPHHYSTPTSKSGTPNEEKQSFLPRSLVLRDDRSVGSMQSFSSSIHSPVIIQKVLDHANRQNQRKTEASNIRVSAVKDIKSMMESVTSKAFAAIENERLDAKENDANNNALLHGLLGFSPPDRPPRSPLESIDECPVSPGSNVSPLLSPPVAKKRRADDSPEDFENFGSVGNKRARKIFRVKRPILNGDETEEDKMEEDTMESDEDKVPPLIMLPNNVVCEFEDVQGDGSCGVHCQRGDGWGVAHSLGVDNYRAQLFQLTNSSINDNTKALESACLMRLYHKVLNKTDLTEGQLTTIMLELNQKVKPFAKDKYLAPEHFLLTAHHTQEWFYIVMDQKSGINVIMDTRDVMKQIDHYVRNNPTAVPQDMQEKFQYSYEDDKVHIMYLHECKKGFQYPQDLSSGLEHYGRLFRFEGDTKGRRIYKGNNEFVFGN